MAIEEINTLFEYSCWATETVMAAAKNLSADQFSVQIQCSHHSLRGTLVHILSADWIWRSRCQKGLSPDQFIDEALFADANALSVRFNNEQAKMRAYLSTLAKNDLHRFVQYKTTKGARHENTLWHMLLHLFNHGTHHRSEASDILARYGHWPGDLDFIIYLRKAQKRGLTFPCEESGNMK